MTAQLLVKVPHSDTWEVVTSLTFEGKSTKEVVLAVERLMGFRDAWQATAVFPAGSTWRTHFPRPA